MIEKPETLQHSDELNELLKIFCNLQPKKIVEIGSLFGGTLVHWIYKSPPGSKIVTIDVVVPPSDGRYNRHRKAHDVDFYSWAKDKGDCEIKVIEDYSTSPKAIKQTLDFLSNEIDFIFIDGDHHYEAVKKDFENYGKYVRKGGVIAFHDIQSYPPPISPVKEVDRFWEEIKHNYKHSEFKFDPVQFGIGVLYV
jgi:predicted O-methyltransferase YrrM